MDVGNVTTARAVQAVQAGASGGKRERVESAYEPETDRVTLSEEAQVRQELELRQRRREERRALLESLLDPEDSVIPARSMGKCAQIAQRVMRGDRVPEEDEKYLMNNAPQLYRQSVMLRQAGEDPELRDSLLDEADLAENDDATAVAAVRPELRRLFQRIWAEEDSDPYAMETGTE